MNIRKDLHDRYHHTMTRQGLPPCCPCCGEEVGMYFDQNEETDSTDGRFNHTPGHCGACGGSWIERWVARPGRSPFSGGVSLRFNCLIGGT